MVGVVSGVWGGIRAKGGGGDRSCRPIIYRVSPVSGQALPPLLSTAIHCCSTKYRTYPLISPPLDKSCLMLGWGGIWPRGSPKICYLLGFIVMTKQSKFIHNSNENTYGSIFGKRALLAIDHIMLALFWSYVPNMK